MANLCIIPARGGSKRIPGKNIREFHARPIIAYAIEAALKSDLFSEVMVSTDDHQVADIGKKFGAKVPFMRSDKNSDDYAPTAAVVDEVIKGYASAGKSFDNICVVYPCTPLLKAETLVRALAILQEGDFDTVFPVVAFPAPVQRALRTEGGRIDFVYPEFALTRTQDLDTFYRDAGQFYMLNTERFLMHGKLINQNSGYIILEEMECQDIDTLDDWKLAEMKYSLNYG